MPPNTFLEEFDDVMDFDSLERELKSMQLTGDLEEIDQYRCTCGLTEGNTMYLSVQDLDTDESYIPVLGIKAYCEPMYFNDNYWTVHCQYYDNFGPPPWYFVHLDVYLERQPWTEETMGWFYWTADGLEYFWCTMTFSIIDAELEYVWK